MGHVRFFARTSGAVLGFAFAFTLVASAQQPTDAKVKTAKQQFKNIRVLKNLPANQLNPAMHMLEGDLGVTCGFCHIVDKWEKDDLKPKATARKMMIMMMALNKNNFEGKQMVTCYTCHRGSPDPVATLVLPATTVKFPVRRRLAPCEADLSIRG